MKVTGKVIVVTGAGNGIGRQVALACIRRGARVAAVDISQDGLDRTVELAASGDRIATFAVDLTDREAVHALPQQVTDTLSAPDGVINVAGIIQPFVRIAELDYDAIQRVIDINLHGTIHVVKAFVPILLERPEGVSWRARGGRRAGLAAGCAPAGSRWRPSGSRSGSPRWRGCTPPGCCAGSRCAAAP
jgi:NAD(P)-dependent dehydrogenase (short-subunit alcohol dehydrogenase family)